MLKNFDPSVGVPDADFNGVLNGCKFWKHSSLAVLQAKLPKTLEDCGASNLVGLAMVRNPLSWLRSFHHVAYDLHECNKGEDWLTRPCTYPRSVPGLLSGTQFPNVEAIWTNWTKDYESLAYYGFKRSLVIRYEDLVLNTSGVLAQIAALANATLKPSDVQQVEQGANPLAEHKQDARTFAAEKITKRAYLSEYTSDELQQICSRVDRAMMRRHGYSDCDDLKL